MLPSPDELSQQLAARFSYPFPDQTNLPRVTQFIGTLDNRRLRKQVLSVLVEQFRKRMCLPAATVGMPQTLSDVAEGACWATTSLDVVESEIHHQLADLELPLYVTTNIDNFMTLALQARTAKPAGKSFHGVTHRSSGAISIPRLRPTNRWCCTCLAPIPICCRWS
jgi:hypothetical protein